MLKYITLERARPRIFHKAASRRDEGCREGGGKRGQASDRVQGRPLGGGPGRGERGILHGVEGGVEDVGGVPVAWHILSVTNLPPQKILNLLLPCMSNSSHFHII